MPETLLERIPIFAGLATAGLALLRSEAEERRFMEGEAIVREGESGNRMFLIAAGGARVVKRRDDGREVVLAELGAFDFFGEMCILETLPRSATVLARGDCTVISLKAGAFLRLYEADPAQYGILLVNLARDLSRRLRRMDEIFAALQ